MTTPEERRLAELLHGSADVVDTGDALDTIRTGVRRRRARRRVALSGAAAVVTGALVATVALGGGTTSSLDPAPQASAPSASPTPSAAPSAAADPDGSTTSQPGTPFFPFTTDKEAAAWAMAPGERAWASDPVQVAQHLVDDLLDLEGVTASPEMVKGRVPLTVDGTVVGSVHMVTLGTGDERPWVALRVRSSHNPDPMPSDVTADPLVVTSPSEGDAVSSPLPVEGTVMGVDESVAVTLRSAAGAQLAQRFAPAGSEQPWSTELSWTAPDWSTGVLTAVTRSARDGSVSRLVAVPVVRDTASRPVPGPTEAFVGEVDGVVGLYSALDGTRLQQVSYPPPGYSDTSPRRSGTKVLWVRVGRECADRKVIQRDLATDVTTTLVADQPLVPVLAASPDGRWTAWAVRPGCETEATTVVVQGPEGVRELEFGSEGDVSGLDLRDDGSLLVELAGEDGGMMAFFAPGADTPIEGFDPGADCLLFNPAFLGDEVLATERCDPFGDSGTVSLVRMTMTGDRVSTTRTQLAGVPELATADGQVLVQRFEQSGAIGRLVDGRFEPLLEQPACRETLEAKGCLTAIDW